MAENVPKLQASRAGYRAHLTQTIKKATNIATKEDPLTDSDITSLKRIVNQLALSTKSSPSFSPSEVTQVVLENTSSQSPSTTVNTNDQTDSGTPNEIVQQDNPPPLQIHNHNNIVNPLQMHSHNKMVTPLQTHNFTKKPQLYQYFHPPYQQLHPPTPALSLKTVVYQN
jgi:hypothetical protein